MNHKSLDPIGKLIGLRYKSHPWHGVEIGENAPSIVTAFIEMVPTDTVKYEIDKKSGFLKIDRPQKYSSILPALYGFIPQTYSSHQVSKISCDILGRHDITGDLDPIDIVVLTEKEIAHSSVLVQAIPIGGFRMIDNNKADDKLIAVLLDDAVYSDYQDISDCPTTVINRLKHYFLTYKDMPGDHKHNSEVTHIYGKEEALRIIEAGRADYRQFVQNMLFDQEL